MIIEKKKKSELILYYTKRAKPTENHLCFQTGQEAQLSSMVIITK